MRTASLNHVYRLVWDLVRGMWVPISETRSARGKAKSSKAGCLVSAGVLVLASTSAFALPSGGSISAGQGQISQSYNQTSINQSSQNLAINWQDFSIGSHQSVTFNQPNANAIALNRVVGQNSSEILGSLKANGQVFILNPNGILFGNNAQINVGGLVASSLGLGDQDFMAGKTTFKGTSSASVRNAGAISANTGGYIALIGSRVSNTGSLTAPQGSVSLAAGQQVTLQLANGSLLGLSVDQGAVNALAQNHGLIQANGGQVLLTAAAADALTKAVVNNTGVIEAQTLDNHNGTIRLLGDMNTGAVNVGGTLDASAPFGGTGGFVDTSAANVHVADSAHITTQARDGLAGTWLIDPKDYTIAASGGNITGAALSSNLNYGNVIVMSSSGTTAGVGNINVNDAVNWSNSTLTLSAAKDININAVMTASGNAGLSLKPATANGADAAVAGGTVKTALGKGRVDFTGSFNSLLIGGTNYTIITTLGSPGGSSSGLQGMYQTLNGHFALGANIDASATGTPGWGGFFNPIGTSTPFSGVFDGLGHTITNLTVNSPSSNSGLFAQINSSGIIRNVGMQGGSINGGGSVGGLVGSNNGGVINNVYATGTVGGTSAVGGLVGVNSGVLSNAYATGAITGAPNSNSVGGLVGANSGTISNVYATGAVSTSNNSNSVGGLVGSSSGTISNAYATGAVSANSYAGGLVGSVSGGTISNTYATGAVSAPGIAGGLIGAGGGIAVSNSYWDLQTSGQTLSAGGVGKTTAQMMTSSTFTGWSLATAGGGGTVWRIYNGSSRPLLESFLTPLTVTLNNLYVPYNGSNQNGAGASYSIASPNLSALLWKTPAKNVGAYTIAATDLYSTQQGYDISAAGSASLNIMPAMLTVGLTGTVSKTYNATNTATLTAANYTVTGVLGTDNVIVTKPTTGTYASKNAGLNIPVNVTGISWSGADAGNYVMTSNSASGYVGNISRAPLTVTASGSNKVYDATTADSVSLSSNAYAGDNISLRMTGAGFANKNAGIAKTINVSGISISGSDINNYALQNTTATTTADISKAALTIGATGTNKVYDATPDASVNLASNAFAGDSVSLANSSASFADKNAGTAKTVSVSGISISGADAGNYALQNTTATTTADISKAPLTIGATGINKVYDATTGASVNLGSNAYAGDSVSLANSSASFADKNAGTAKTVSVSGISISGADAGNYALQNITTTTTADITKAALTVNATGINKVYDGTTDASVNLGSNAYAGDSVSLANSSASFTDSNVGTAKTVNVGGISISGADAGNYELQNVVTTTRADITSP